MFKMFKQNLILNLNLRISQNERFSYRMVSSMAKPVITLNENVEKDIENEKYKPRRHPGIAQNKTISMPEPILKSLERVIIGKVIAQSSTTEFCIKSCGVLFPHFFQILNLIFFCRLSNKIPHKGWSKT